VLWVRKKHVFLLLVLSIFFVSLSNVYGATNNSLLTIQQAPSFDFVGYETGETIYNNSVVYRCANLTVIINVSDSKALDYLNITVNGVTATYDLSLQTSATVTHTIPVEGPGIYDVSIVVVNANNDEAWYFFRIVCCDDTPPNITVSIGDVVIPPYTIYSICGNVTVDISITDIVGLSYVEIDITRNGELFSIITRTPGGDTSYEESIDISLSAGDTYVIVVHAMDMCQNSIEYEYTIVCSQDDKPPIIWNVTACNMSIRPGACVCCCKSPLRVIASDDFGITRVELYIDGTLKDTRLYTPPSPSVMYSYTLDLSEGVYLITIVVYDTSGNTARFVFFDICDRTPPTIDVYVDGTAVSNRTTLDLRTINLTVIIQDNLALDTIVIGINYDYDMVSLPRCPLGGTTSYTYSRIISEDLAIDKLFARLLMIKIVATDWCGHKVVFYFTLRGPSRGPPVLPPIMYLIIYGIGLISAGTVILVVSLLRRKFTA